MGVTAKCGMILLAHGARHPGWAEPFERVRQQLAQRLPQTDVALAFLEFMRPDLVTAVEQLVRQQCAEIVVVPMFLGQSGHVLRDLPPMLAQLQQAHPATRLRLVRAAGDDAGVQAALAAYCLQALAAG
ncbi:MAG: cobalamin biosynthesis protein CbiX [Burkholderiaceae bacterium]|nr:cobalamin biosynthesis protein CbiX [Burkholderiaceae bacterium]